jgi:hypothetical protein
MWIATGKPVEKNTHKPELLSFSQLYTFGKIISGLYKEVISLDN